ncbi:major outer membrane protein [Helicobacter sp. MIT 05-5294]|uniref:major outer membrane protein n=1 Tax=Helicobacter sp. MIT 05-5294 TaxID=1548150 RepID=UPI0010FF097D|nr:major outer membrane protein [Helicobacter sp. MIT 05-5294]TLD86767.1 major outer membrane protein [Helicobacter sp. MIT 05-5294]
MKFLKLSLAASVALGALSTASFAQPLEDAIKGIDVSGYLRYRYNDDRYENNGFNKNSVNGSNATHRWKAVADFKAPVADNVAFNFGILYNNESQNVNHGNGTNIPNPNYTPWIQPGGAGYQPATLPVGGLGSGLGSGKDGSFGVSTFNAVITPDSTATTVIIGKQRLATPVTNAGDDDRGTGILVLNSDLENATFAAGAFDSWSIDDVALLRGYTSGSNDGGSVDKPLYALAGIYNFDTDYGTFGAQLWGFYIQDAVDALGVLDLSWNNATFNAGIKYAIAKLNNDNDSVLATLHGVASARHADISEANDLFIFNVGANFAQEYDFPLDIKLGYVTNFQDGTAVTLNDDGNFFTNTVAGAIWWQNDATGISSSALLDRGVHGFGTEQEISVFYGAVGYTMVDSRLRVGLDFVWGENEIDWGIRGVKNDTIDFMEITPKVSWKHNKQLTISGYYAYLTTDKPDSLRNVAGQPALYDDETRTRARVEVKYSF